MPVDTELLESVKGFLDPEEGQRLYETALVASQLGPCLEIGSYCGKSTIYIGTACQENGSVLFSIDHHRGSEEQQPGQQYFDPDLFDEGRNRIDTFPYFMDTIEKAGLQDTVVPIVCKSAIAARQWTTPLALVFIDGGHSFEDAFTDYSAWAHHLIPGGYLLIHDIFEDPKKGGQAPFEVYKLALASGLFEEMPRTKTLGVLKRRLF
ncbi:MAG: class I SAM-dependent methyltransferase [Deltaproteobacteria bacterium]|nr:MAG: class I SAM-dependent methyltransferase [Deltaproteobacteria bacterium]